MWTGDVPLHNQPIQIRSHRRRRAELSDWTIPIGHEQPLAALNAPKILAEVLTKLCYTHSTRHVQNCSISGRHHIAWGEASSCLEGPPLASLSEAEAHQDHAGEDGEKAEQLEQDQRHHAPHRRGVAGLDRRRHPLP